MRPVVREDCTADFAGRKERLAKKRLVARSPLTNLPRMSGELQLEQRNEDDELDSLPLFQPSSRTGLTEEIVAGAADYLNGKTDKDMRCNRFVRAVQNLHAVFTGHRG